MNRFIATGKAANGDCNFFSLETRGHRDQFPAKFRQEELAVGVGYSFSITALSKFTRR